MKTNIPEESLSIVKELISSDADINARTLAGTEITFYLVLIKQDEVLTAPTVLL